MRAKMLKTRGPACTAAKLRWGSNSEAAGLNVQEKAGRLADKGEAAVRKHVEQTLGAGEERKKSISRPRHDQGQD